MSFQPLSARFSDALVLAADIHRNQTRKGTDTPYVSHVLAVASIAQEFGADEDEAIAALLHDAIEDAPSQLGPDAAMVVRSWMAMKFGDRVLAIVEACTDTDVQPKPPWVARKREYIDAIPHKSASAVLVGAADKLHNVRAILRDFRTHRAALWMRFNKEAGEAGTVGYYRGLVVAYRSRLSTLEDPRLGPLVQELDEVVTMLEREVGFAGVWPPVRSPAD